MVGMMGRVSDRFHEYQPARSFRDRLTLAKRVQSSDGVEVVYPTEFENREDALDAIKGSGLTLSAVNLNVKGEKRWQNGSFTSHDPRIRERAVEELKNAMDLANLLSVGMVSCCPLIDGHNYAFEVDYTKQWGWLEDCVEAGVNYRRDVKLSMEYKLNESRNSNVLSDMGRVLYLCERVGASNLGVTMDVGHSLIARETPAEALCLAAARGKLFYVHFNDNARDWDWDMIPGSVNFWDLLETVFYMKLVGYGGWISYDVLVRDGDMVESMETSIRVVKMAEKLVDKIGMEKIKAMIERGRPDITMRELIGALT